MLLQPEEIERIIEHMDAGKAYFFKESLGPEHTRREYRAIGEGKYEVYSMLTDARRGDQTKRRVTYNREQIAVQLSYVSGVEEIK